MSGTSKKNYQACKRARKYDPQWGDKSINWNQSGTNIDVKINRQGH